MTEQKRERKIKVLVKRSIFLENDVKTPAGSVVLLTADQVKHYGSAVTRDLPAGVDD